MGKSFEKRKGLRVKRTLLFFIAMINVSVYAGALNKAVKVTDLNIETVNYYNDIYRFDKNHTVDNNH